MSDRTRETLRDYGYKGEVTVVRNGTEFTYPENAQVLIDQINQKHNLADKENVFLFVGRLAVYKNLELSIRSLRVLKDKGIEFTMLVVGSGFDEQKFKNLVHELGLDENFIFTGRVDDREFLKGYYLRANLFLFPSLFDTSGIVTIEAAANKLPSLLIAESDAADGITDKVTGYLAENNVESFSSKIIEIINDKEKLRQVSENAYQNIYCSWESKAKELEGKYSAIIDEYKHKKR